MNQNVRQAFDFEHIVRNFQEPILFRLDAPEILNLRMVNHGIRVLTRNPVFVARFNERENTHLWVFTHYVNNVSPNEGFLRGFRSDDGTVVSFPLRNHLFELGIVILEEEEFRLETGLDTIFVFSLRRRNRISLIVVDPFRNQQWWIPCEVPPFSQESFGAFFRIRLSLVNRNVRGFRLQYLEGNLRLLRFSSEVGVWNVLDVPLTNTLENLHRRDPRNMFFIDMGLTRIVIFGDGHDPSYVLRASIFQHADFVNEPLEPGHHMRHISATNVAGWRLMIEVIEVEDYPVFVITMRQVQLLEPMRDEGGHRLAGLLPVELIPQFSFQFGGLRVEEPVNGFINAGVLVIVADRWGFLVIRFHVGSGRWTLLPPQFMDAQSVTNIVMVDRLRITTD